MSRDAIPYELEGMVSTVTVLRLLSDDLGAVQKALRNKIEQMPGFFLDAAVAVDLSALEGTDEDSEEEAPAVRREVPLAQIANMLRELKLVPVGVRNLREARRAEARAAGMGVMRGTGRKPAKAPAQRAQQAQAQQAQPAKEDRRSGDDRRNEPPVVVPSVAPSTLVQRTPLRSGQVVYAEQCDAVVLAPVNAGAELIADGNIHVYAALRGRALAGAHGNEEARIFCKSLEAELIAIAGCYLRSDEIPEKRRGKPAQIYLEKGQLVIADL